MPVGITLLTDPSGSQFTSTIGSGEPDSKNDFAVFISLDSNGTGLTLDNLSVSHGSIVAVEGSGATWKATVRPPETAVAALTFTVAANAFSEGNTETSKDIRISTTFPDADAEVPTELFTVSLSAVAGIAVSPTRILISNNDDIYFYDHSGTEQASEELQIGRTAERLDYFNETFFNGARRYALNNATVIEYYTPLDAVGYRRVVHTRLGVLSGGEAIRPFRVLPYGKTETADLIEIDAIGIQFSALAHQNDLLYLLLSSSGGNVATLAEITTDDAIQVVRRLNIDPGVVIRDIAIYRETLYFIEDSGTTGTIHTLDIRKYRPLSLNTKTRIDVQFINEGGTLDAKRLCPDAEKVIFSTGFNKPTWLSVDSDTGVISVASNAVTETSPIFVELTGINRIDSIDFSFYLIVRQAAAPTWRDVESLSMKAHTSYDLHQIVDADSIAFESGETQPTGSSLSDGVFTIATTAGTAYFRATKDGLTTDKAIAIDVIQLPDPDNFSDITRYKIEIAGIDVTPDYNRDSPLRLTKSLDDVELSRYRAHSVTVSLRDSEGKYSPDLAGNFWETNNLNPGGYQEEIKVYRESFINDAWVGSLLFVGVIEQQAEQFSAVQVNITAKDISVELERLFISDFGTLLKWDSLRQQSDEATFEGVYVPEGSLLPMQPEVAKAWSDRTELTLRRLQLPTKGPPLSNTGHLTASDFRTSGGFLQTPPILNAKTSPRSEDATFLFDQLALTESVYNTDIQLPDVVLDDPTVFNRGSVPFSVENTRITRLMRDWVHDTTSDRLLMLLSNPEGHVADLLVQYNVESDSHRVLHTFDKDISVHRITRRTSTDYYILSAKAIAQDRSTAQLPRAIDGTGYAYDSSAEGSEIKILRYNASTDTLTEHVDESDTQPPQIGIHYHVGFENDIYIDEFEGIRPDYRGAFKFQGSNLYYRYATDAEFGVARVNTSGTTSEMIDQTTLNYNNHLNFAFDITSGGDIYFVYATGDAETSTLTIKRRTSGGVETTLFSETRGIGYFDELGLDWGAFLGAYEALFHNNHLYILAPVQKAQLGDDFQSIINPDVNIEQLTAEKTGERNVTTTTNLNPTNLTLAPGDDIPLRIDFDGSVTGATQDDLTVYGGTIESFSISSDMIDVTIRPDSQSVHQTIIVDLAEDAVDQTNEAWRITIDFETTRSRTKAAGSVLYRCDVTNANPSLTVLDQWDFATLGGCNLIVHDGAVHFMEQPPAAAQITPINPDLDTYNETMGRNVIPEGLGALKKVESDGSVTDLGNLWYDERPYNVAGARALSFDDELHVTMGYGNANEVLRYNSLASKADNFVHLVFGNRLKYIVPAFQPSGNVYSKIAELARMVGATASFDGNIISVVDRRPFRAKADGTTGTGTGNLDVDSENKTFPSSGYLRIGDEFIGYTGISSGAFTGITRGALGSEPVSHLDNTGVLFVNALFSEREILQINPSTDTTRHHNIIRDGENLFEVSDDDSIAQYRKQPYTLDLGLTRNEDAWIETIFAEYLSELKNLGSVVDLKLRPQKKSFALDLGQFIGLRHGSVTYVLRIELIDYHLNRVDIKGRSVATTL